MAKKASQAILADNAARDARKVIVSESRERLATEPAAPSAQGQNKLQKQSEKKVRAR
jgi:hypothetical protein